MEPINTSNAPTKCIILNAFLKIRIDSVNEINFRIVTTIVTFSGLVTEVNLYTFLTQIHLK